MPKIDRDDEHATRYEMTDTKPTIDEQIAYLKKHIDDDCTRTDIAILASLERLKQIESAEMPEQPFVISIIGPNKDVQNYIDALQAVIQHMSKELSDAVHLNDEQAQRVYTAERELAECRKDAERYRWLRELPNADSLNVQYIGADLDNVIDAAIDSAIKDQP
jgi:hypothetical protein